jgi:hypothetical protein
VVNGVAGQDEWTRDRRRYSYACGPAPAPGFGTKDAWAVAGALTLYSGAIMPDDLRRTDPPREPQRDVHVYNQPAGGGGGGPAVVIGIVLVVLVLAALWFAFGRGGRVVPERIDVDINLPATEPATPRQPAPAEPAPQPAPPPTPPGPTQPPPP